MLTLRSNILLRRPFLPQFYRTYSRVDTNRLNESNRAEKTLAKFWTKVKVIEISDQQQTGYAVTLDNKPIRTSAGHKLIVPKSKSEGLAELIAQEWSVITTTQIKPHALPLTSLAARAIDLQQTNNDQEKSQIIKWLLPYLDTDTLLIIAPTADCEGKLRESQLKEYYPIIQDAENFWGGHRLSILDSDKRLYGNVQSEQVKQSVTNWIHSLDSWKLAGLERATSSAKSLIAGMNIVTNKLPVDKIAHLVNLEVYHQTQLWGEVEDTHDVDHADLRRILGAAYLIAN